jgi:hypothetical protein
MHATVRSCDDSVLGIVPLCGLHFVLSKLFQHPMERLHTILLVFQSRQLLQPREPLPARLARLVERLRRSLLDHLGVPDCLLCSV